MKISNQSPEFRAALIQNVKPLLDTRRNTVIVDDNHIFDDLTPERCATVPIWAVQLVIEWAEDLTIGMSLEEYLSGMLFGEGWDGERDVLDLLAAAPLMNQSTFNWLKEKAAP